MKSLKILKFKQMKFKEKIVLYFRIYQKISSVLPPCALVIVATPFGMLKIVLSIISYGIHRYSSTRVILSSYSGKELI